VVFEDSTIEITERLFASPSRRDTGTADMFESAVNAPDAAAKLGTVKAGRMHALNAYKTLTAKRAKVGLTTGEEQQLLEAETALGQKLAFDMESVKGGAPATVKESLTVPPPAFGSNRRTAQDEMSRAGEIDRKGQISLFASATVSERDEILANATRNSKGYLLAPNGKPSKLTDDQWAAVRTRNFKRWFGDWEKFAAMEGGVWNDSDNSVSKAVDENGEPIVVYHGSQEAGFDIFDPSLSDSRQRPNSVFFSDSRNTARTYSGSRDDVNFAKDEDGEFTPHAAIYAVFLNIRNPNEANFEGANWDGTRSGQFVVVDDGGEQFFTDSGKGYFNSEEDAQELADMNDGAEVIPAENGFESTNSVARDAQQYGNDGAIIREVIDDGGQGETYDTSTVFVVFDARHRRNPTSRPSARRSRPRSSSRMKC